MGKTNTLAGVFDQQTQPVKNYIINGAMMVSQEWGTTALTTSGQFPVDQFSVSISSSGTVQFAQQAAVTPGGSPNRLGIIVTAADTSIGSAEVGGIVHLIEGYKIADAQFGTANAKYLTLRFGVRAPQGTYCVTIRQSGNRSYVAEYTISALENNVDTVKSITFRADQSGTWPKNNTTGISITWTLFAGSNYVTTPGSWQAGNYLTTSNQFNFMGTNGNVFHLFDVGLYAGKVAPDFIVPDFAQTLQECLRYWEKSYNYATAPGTPSTSTGMKGAYDVAASSQQVMGWCNFLVPKCANGTVTIYNYLSGASNSVYNAGNGASVVPIVDGISENGFRIYATVTNGFYYQYTANARLS